MHISHAPQTYTYMISLIACVIDKNKAIGYKNKLLFRIKKDLAHFKKLTTGHGHNIIVMGYHTFLSLGKKALPGRKNIVVTRKHYSELYEQRQRLGIHVLSDLCFLKTSLKTIPHEDVFIIGGEQMYTQALHMDLVDRIFMTTIVSTNFDYTLHDTVFPPFKGFKRAFESKVHRDTNVVFLPDGNIVSYLEYMFVTYEKTTHDNLEEQRYLDLVAECLNAEKRQTRNAVTRSVFAKALTFDIDANGFPLLTTKRMPYKSKMIEKELLFFLNGHTNVDLLRQQNVHIWTPNTTQAFLEASKKDLKEDDMGPMYGWQWRHFGAKYMDCKHDYTGQGIDQLKSLIQSLKDNPGSRRHLMTTFNPSQVEQGCLWPCHSIVIQCYVRGAYLDMVMYQRSADIICGVPFNIASSALLLMLLAQQCKYRPGKLTLFFGDVHMYDSHEAQAKIQLSRRPFPFPRYEISKKDTIDAYTLDDFKLDVDTYTCHKRLHTKMVA